MMEVDEELQQVAKYTIFDLPDEVLEFVFGFLPPYEDLQNCMCVCKRWFHCVQSVKRKTSINLVKAITEFKVRWKTIVAPTNVMPSITRRFSHSACILNNSMYIFGGCTTSATSFNDLWRFDLSRREWVRPLATGTYPVPKAYTSMVGHRDNLIVFGGWTYSSPVHFYQNISVFNDTHFYNITSNRWTLVKTVNSPPAIAGHSSCVINNEMIVFGGLTKVGLQIQCSNDIWILNLDNLEWRIQLTSKPKPAPRYAQSLMILDDDRLILLGGAQTFNVRYVFNDCWILTMKGRLWSWTEVEVKNKEWAAANIWCNPACLVGDKVVSLSRCRNGVNGAKPLVTSAVRLRTVSDIEDTPLSVRVENSMRTPLDLDQNVNGKRGIFPRRTLAHNKRYYDDADQNEPVAGPCNEPVAEPNNEMVVCPSIEPVAGPSNEVAAGPSHEAMQLCDANSTNSFSNNAIASKVLFSSANIRDSRKSPLRNTRSDNMKIVRQLQEANKFRMAAFACDPAPNIPIPENYAVNPRPLGHLEIRQVPEQPRPIEPPAPYQPLPKRHKRNTLTIHVLDVSTVVNGNSLDYVTWLSPNIAESGGGPEELVMYTLLKGNGELIMFGGVYNDINLENNVTPHLDLYSNAMHIITIPRDII